MAVTVCGRLPEKRLNLIKPATFYNDEHKIKSRKTLKHKIHIKENKKIQKKEKHNSVNLCIYVCYNTTSPMIFMFLIFLRLPGSARMESVSDF